MKIEDTIICIDTSRSMFRKDFEPSRIQAVKNALKEYVEIKNQMDDRDRIALVTFSSEAKVILEMTNDIEEVKNAIDSIKIGGTTGLGEGLAVGIQLVVKEIQAVGAKIYRMLVLSDGKPWVSTINPLKMSKIAAGLKLSVDTIGLFELGVAYQESILEKISSATNGEYARVYDTASLRESLSNVANKKEVPYSASQEQVEATTAMFLESIAGDLLHPAELSESQEQLINLLLGREKDKCIICFQDVCPHCHGPFYACGRYCPNCKSPMHLHCAAEWAAATKAEGESVFRCTRCFFLLRVPKSISKVKILRGSRPRTIEEQNLDTTRFIIVKEESEELLNSVCPICHMIFEKPPAYLCTTCNTYYHPKCLDKYLQTEMSCRVCGKKIEL
ncbi:MAG: VWA domain-containing protein [Candidatus Helarchaeota archaeon]